MPLWFGNFRWRGGSGKNPNHCHTPCVDLSSWASAFSSKSRRHKAPLRWFHVKQINPSNRALAHSVPRETIHRLLPHVVPIVPRETSCFTKPPLLDFRYSGDSWLASLLRQIKKVA